MGADAQSARLNPLVSVIIPTYNGEAFLRATLDSVLQQTYSPFEIVVCDDESRDSTLAILASYEALCGDRLRIVCQPNGGVASARNRAVEHARGTLLAFLDQDDLWEPHMLATLVPKLVARPECGLAYADSWIIDAHGHRRGRRGRFLKYASGSIFDALLRGNFVPVETTLMRTELYRELGGCNPLLRYLEDYDLCLRAARRTRVAFHPAPLASYRVHDRNLSHELEPMLVEWVRLLDQFAVLFPDLALRQVRRIESERSRLCADIAWKQLRRFEEKGAQAWLTRAGTHAPRALVWRIRAFRLILGVLPLPWANRVLRALPRRRLYGVLVPTFAKLVLRQGVARDTAVPAPVKIGRARAS